MKKVFNIVNKGILFSCIIYLFLFNISCGLDNYIVMQDPVSQLIHVPEYDSIQFQERYFEFFTNENASYPDGFMYLGTDIYYKIYSSPVTMASERSTLDTLADDIETAAKAPDKLIDGFKFQRLKVTNVNNSPIISPANMNQRVYIRLSDFQNADEYASKIQINGENLDGSTFYTKPIRSFDDLTFNFGRKETNDKVPLIDDEDVKATSEPSDNKWYVCMYAVGVGRDVTYTNYYSNIVYLGAVTIDASDENN